MEYYSSKCKLTKGVKKKSSIRLKDKERQISK
jgi:hypothetical protein